MRQQRKDDHVTGSVLLFTTVRVATVSLRVRVCEGSDEWHTCHVRDDDYCFIHFAYNYDTDEVRVQRTKGSMYTCSSCDSCHVNKTACQLTVSSNNKRDIDGFKGEPALATFCSTDYNTRPIYTPLSRLTLTACVQYRIL